MPRVTGSPSTPPGSARGSRTGGAADVDHGRAVLAGADAAVEEVHLRAADEAGDEAVDRVVVEVERRADLLDAAAVQHHDLVGHGHRLDLVVGDVDHGVAEVAVQRRDLDAHLHAQLGVEVRRAARRTGRSSARARWRGRWRRAGAGRRRAPCGLRSSSGSMRRISAARRDARLDLGLAAGRRSRGRRRGSCRPTCAGRARSSGTPWRCRACAAGTSFIRSPSSSSAPPEISSSPAIIRSSVDLPQPEGPTKTANSPGSMREVDAVDHRHGAVVLHHLVEHDAGRHLRFLLSAGPGPPVGVFRAVRRRPAAPRRRRCRTTGRSR